MTEIVQPAIEAARSGAKLHNQTKYQVDILEPILTASAEGRAMYTIDGKLAGLNDSVLMPHYADLLEYMAKNGPDEFYKGEVAHHVVRACNERGGYLTMDDFSDYEVILRKPLEITYRNYQLSTTPPPNAGGPLIAFLLKLLENESMQPESLGSRQHLSWLTRGIILTARAREERLESLIHDPDLIKHLMDPGYLRQMQQMLNHSVNKPGNTTHVSVVDSNKNIASVTTSVGEGCGYIIPGTDIMLNNMLGEEDLNKNGFHHWIPDKRISSMMAPTVISKNKRPVMGLGSGGSNRIRSAIVQAITNYIDFHLDYDDVVNKPRIHWENGHLDVEQGIDREEVEAIELPDDNKKFFWSEKNMYFGGVHAVFIDEKGGLHGAGDRRRAGSVIRA
jgi:gamma-glutamyltranspeptidase/glutathione hydrolase